MDKSIKLAVAGLALASVAIGGGYLVRCNEESALEALVTRCKAEALSAPKGPWLNYQKAPLICEPTELSGLSPKDAVGIQRDIVVLAPSAGRIFRFSTLVAAALLAFFCAPYAWYFLLRRVREISSAVRNDA